VRRAGILLALVLAAVAPAGAAVAATVTGYGCSHGGRALRVATRCAPGATTVDVLVIGAIHGNETAGRAVVQRLAQGAPPAGTCWHLLSTLNPDGVARGTRQNARGVDLNRNFPYRWSGGGRPFDVFFPGRARASERETRAALAMVRAIRPDVTIWYHQHRTMTVRPPLPWREALAGAYARVARLPVQTYPGPELFGTASSWQHAEFPLSLALVIELPAGALDAASLRRHVAAVRTVGTLARFDRADVP
jgi:protein MpaA